MAFFKAVFNKIFRLFKNLIVFIFSNIIRFKRFGINSHNLNSVEITTIKQGYETKPPSREILSFVANITSQYFSAKINLPSDQNSVWDIYNNGYVNDHYRLLAIITKTIDPKQIVEIGTFRGASTKTFLLNSSAKIITYDLISWLEFKPTYLEQDDFKQAQIVQKLENVLENKEKFKKDLLSSQLLFIDGPKNFTFEKELFSYINEIKNEIKKLYIIVDDTKVSTMVDIWSGINIDKIDLSFIGHWSGTGLILINNEN